MKESFTEIIIIEVTKILMPLEQLNSIEKVTAFLNELGWTFTTPEGDFDLSELLGIDDLITIFTELRNAETDEETLDIVGRLAKKITAIISNINTATPKLKEIIENSDFLGNTDDIIDVLPLRLLDYLLYHYLQTHYQRIFAVLHLMGIIETVAVQNIPIKTVQWDRIPLLFSDPMDVADEAYKWNNNSVPFEGNEFLNRLEILLGAFLLPGGIYKQADDIREKFGRTEDGDDKEIRIPLFQRGVWPGSWMELDLNLSPIPAITGKKSGLALYPYLTPDLNIEKEIADNWILEISGDANLDAGFGVIIRAPHNLELMIGLFEKTSEYIDARLEVVLKRTSQADSLSYIFGAAESSHLALKEVGIKILLALKDGDEEFGSELNIDDLSICIDPANDADGFIQKLLSGIKLESVSDLTIGISNKDGFYFLGSSALAIEIPIHKSLGPISINTITIGVGFDEKINVILAVSFSFELGPIIGAVDRIGLEIPFSISSDNSGNLGPVQIDGIQFKPPTGVGMLVDADVVTGGGFIEFDRINERYAGILQLSFGEIGLTAIGLITTRMPDGSPGFSMLISVSVEFSPEIQLTMGFTLSAVGGLIGINRTMDLAALEKRFRNRALDSILFPKDPILNASKIISDLRAVFPPKEDRYVIGAMVAIGYGNPNIIRGEIGIFIEIPEPIRASIMGQISAILPEEDNPIVVLNLDVLGIIRPSKKKITIDSVLYDSRILYLNLFGDAAIWLKWGKNPQFIMSLGGFHPKFTPPPGFPKLQRLTLALNWGNTLFMLFQFYMAITPNSLQFGTKFDITIKWGKAVITGGMSFDALFYFSPFSFEVDITGYVVAKAFGKELSNIRLYFNLSGPTPWHAIGSARFKILFVKFKVDFDIIKGSVRTIDPIPAVDPWIPLKKALERRQAWSSSLPPTRNMVESLRPIDEPEDVKDKKSMPVLVHPAGKLEVRQNVLPFEVTLDKFGNAPVKDHNYFSITSITSGNELECKPVKEYFAKKPFKNLTIKEQLSSESYELQQAGIEITSEAIKVPGKMKAKSLEYEVIPIDDDGTSKQQGNGRLSWEAGKRQIKLNAAGQSLIRRKGHRAFEIPDHKPGIHVNEEKCRIVFNSNMKSVSALKYIVPNYQEDMKRSEAEAALEKYLRKHPENLGKVQMVNSYEVLV